MVFRKSSTDLPPGFRFHPTDEELIMYYLKNQAMSKPCPISIIPEVDIYKFDPWQLPEKAEFGENEWYFFTPRDRKYPNGVRPNRAAVSGYWKATGTDKSIHSKSQYVGVKKALVFYKGKPPKGIKTDWIMHEYRLNDTKREVRKQVGSMRLDDWVLCRIYKKKNLARATEPKLEDETLTIDTNVASSDFQMLKFPRNCSLSHLWELDYLGSLSQLLNENTYNSNFDHQSITLKAESCSIIEDELSGQYMDPMKAQVSYGGTVTQPIFVHPVFNFQ